MVDDQDQVFLKLVKYLQIYKIANEKNRKWIKRQVKTMVLGLQKIYGTVDLKDAIYERIVTPPIVFSNKGVIFL